jgi:vacuolar-type H+-ATPase subunit I/STV1
MGSAIPRSIRKNVLRNWLLGLPRAQIAKECEIGAGTVSIIIKEYKENDSELDTIRELAVKLKKENLDSSSFSSAVRLRKILEKKKGLSEEQIESLVETIDIHCFKGKTRFKEFIDAINKVSSLSESFRIPLSQLPEQITEKEKELKDLREEIRSTEEKSDGILKEYNTTKRDLEEYNRLKPQLESYNSMKKQLHKYQLQLISETNARKVARYIDQNELNLLNQRLSTPISTEELLRMLNYIRYSPSINLDVIKIMQERMSEIPEELQSIL